jgi:hypothetical protein
MGAATCHDFGLGLHSFGTEGTVRPGETIECYRVFCAYFLTNMKPMYSSNNSTIYLFSFADHNPDNTNHS